MAPRARLISLALAPLLTVAGCATTASAPRPDEPPASSGPILELVGDVAAVPMRATSFAALSREQRLLAYHLTEAALAAHPVVYLQSYRHDLLIWQLCEALLSRAGALDPDFVDRLRQYRRRIFIHHGIHDAWTEEKFDPPFAFEELTAAAAAAEAAGAHLPDGLALATLRMPMFDRNVDRFRVAKTPGPAGDPVAASAVNHYGPGTTAFDLDGWQDRFPLNSRISRKDGRLVEEPYRAGGTDDIPPGLGAGPLAAAVAHLEAAEPFAPPEERHALARLEAFLRTGENATFDDHDRAWLQHRTPVDYVFGFIEQRADPRQVKGMFEGVVAARDPARDAPLQRLADEAAYFEERLPFAPEYRRPAGAIRRPTASAVDVLAASGDALAFTFAGVTLPNNVALRERDGSKSWVAVSVSDARDEVEGEALVREFVLPEVADEAVRCAPAVRFAQVAFHELAGHPSGRVDPRLLRSDPRQALAPYYSTLEEARADLVAAWLLEDPRTVTIGLLPDAGCQRVASQLLAMELLTLLRTVPKGDAAEQDALRARLLIGGWQLERGALRVVERGGRHHVQVTDSRRWREGIAALLDVLQRAKSQGQRAVIEALVEKYATRIDPALRDEVLARVGRLGLPPRIATLPPIIEPVVGPAGELVDARARPARSVDDLIEVFERAR